MFKVRLGALVILLMAVFLGFVIYNTEKEGSNFNFKYGLDLSGGTHLTYRADTAGVKNGDVAGAMESLRKTVERRINIFGVSEPIVQVEKGSLFSSQEDEHRLIVELPGVTDVNEAIKMIGKTPILEFRLEGEPSDLAELYVASTTEDYIAALAKAYIPTGLTGSQLQRASLNFNQGGISSPIISLQFNDDGRNLLSEITKNNINKTMAIFLDGNILSAPVIRDEILNGQAQITGQFNPEEAKKLVQDLNYGALPLPVQLIETQSIGATLGSSMLNAGVLALLYGLVIIFIFMILWYRLPGLVASISLIFYIIIMLLAFKFIPVVLTASGIAGFILSIGMAVDANILIFERIKEEMKNGLSTAEAVKQGIKRAWSSIRDGNLTSLISAVILYWLSGTAVVQGFALVFFIGILVSMFSAMVVSRIFLLAVSSNDSNKLLNKLFKPGFGSFN
jgi:preprotein translocase subunit SecD